MKKREEDQFEKLARLIKEEGEETRTELRAEVKQGFTDVRTDILALSQRVTIIEKDLGRISEQTKSNTGFAKEIDILRAEITDIKKHLGLKTKIVA